MQGFKKVQKNSYAQCIGEALIDTSALNFKQQHLLGRSVKLHALSLEHINAEQLDQLWQLTQAEPVSSWTYLPYSGFSSKALLQQQLVAGFNFPSQVHYLLEVDQQCCGWLALLNLRAAHRVVEIGNVYFSSQLKRSYAATEAIYLLLKNCFAQGVRRVEWKCDELNTPSYRAALRFGFEYEGTFRQDRIVKGHNRNTAWFSILDEEWPVLDKAYQQWLSEDNFDEQGQQKTRLSEFILVSREDV